MTDTAPPTSTATDPLSAGDALFDDPTSAATILEQAISRNGLLDTLPPESPTLSNVAARLLLGQIIDQIIAMLRHLPLSDMLMEGWAQLDKIVEARAATRLDGSSRDVSVLEHQINIAHQPTIEMIIDEVAVPLLTLGLDITFKVTSCNVGVSAGDITRVEPGPVAVKSSLRSGSLTLLEHTIHQIDPTRLLGTLWPTLGSQST